MTKEEKREKKQIDTSIIDLADTVKLFVMARLLTCWT